MTTESKIVAVLIGFYLYFHWASLRAALATGATGAAGNSVPGYSTTGGTWTGSGAGNVSGIAHNGIRNSWGSDYE